MDSKIYIMLPEVLIDKNILILYTFTVLLMMAVLEIIDVIVLRVYSQTKILMVYNN